MAELEEKLNSILSDPEAMGQIVSIAKALTGEDAGRQSQPQPAPAPADGYVPVESEQPPSGSPAPAQDGAAQQPDWSAVLGLLSSLSGGASADPSSNPLSALGDLDPKLVSAAVRLFSEYSAADDRKIALLTALKPFLKEERYARVDKAVQIAKLSRVIRVAFQLFKKGGGEAGV